MNKAEIYRRLADEVQRLMTEAGLSPSDLARKIKVSPAYITQFLKYGQKTPVERIQQMLDVFDYEIIISKKKLHLLT